MEAQHIKTPAEAKALFEKIRWGGSGRPCPRCKGQELSASKHKEMNYWCKGCKKYASVRTGTRLENTRTSLINLVRGAVGIDRFIKANPTSPLFLHTEALGGGGMSAHTAKVVYRIFYEADAIGKGLTIEERLRKLLGV